MSDKFRIVWNQTRTVGVIVKDDRDGEKAFAQLAYELRKGALNSLGVVSPEFVEAWAEMTADDACTIEDVTLPAEASVPESPGVKILANRSSMSPDDVRKLLLEILEDGPTAPSAARTLAIAIGGPSKEHP